MVFLNIASLFYEFNILYLAYLILKKWVYRISEFQELETITSRMRRLFQAGTGSLYFLSPECFPLPFEGVTRSFPRLNGAPRSRPLFPCLLRWSTSNERKRDSIHTKTKKKSGLGFLGMLFTPR